NIEDLPNHIARVYEIHATFPSNAPVINGQKLADLWTRGTADLSDGNGGGTQYLIFVMDNGDRFHVRNANVAQNIAGQFTATSSGQIISGTGKFAAIQGVVHSVAKFNFQTGFTETQYDISYAMSK